MLFSSADAYTPKRGRTLDTYKEWREKTDTPSNVHDFFEQYLDEYPDRAGFFTTYSGQTREVGDDYMQNPVDTYLRGGGDCEDYAALAADWLAHHQYETKIIFFYGSGKGHAVCAVKENDMWSYLGNDAYKKGYSSIEELVKRNAARLDMNLDSYYEIFQDDAAFTGWSTAASLLIRSDRTEESYEQDKANVKTPAQMEAFMKKYLPNILPDKAGWYITRTGKRIHVGDEYLQEPIDTYLRGGGFGDDHAALAADWLKFHGYETKLIRHYSSRIGLPLFFCAVKENDTWSYLAINGYMTGFPTIKSVVDYAGKEWEYYAEIIPDNKDPRGYKEVEIVRR